MFSKKQPLSALREGDRVDDVFVVKIKKGVFPYKKGHCLILILSDASGASVKYTYWGTDETSVRQLAAPLHTDAVVHLQGRAEVYESELRISTNPPDTIQVVPPGEYNTADFIGPPRRNVQEMEGELSALIASVKNGEIKKVLGHIFTTTFTSAFARHPASIERHHNWTAGLLQHVLEMAQLAEKTVSLLPGLDRDLLMAGVLLHDIGKVEEMEVTTRVKGSFAGQLNGHIPIGYHLASTAMKELGTDAVLREKLLHLITSHHGQLAFGSPKEPMFPEAVALHYIDQLSAQVTSFLDDVQLSRNLTEDQFMYSKYQRRNILLR